MVELDIADLKKYDFYGISSGHKISNG